MQNRDVLLFTKKIKAEESSQARFIRWYYPDRFGKNVTLPKPRPWDGADTAQEAIHGFVRTEVKPAARPSAEALARRERRAIRLVDEYNHQPSLYFRPRDSGGVVTTLHDWNCGHVFAMPPDPNKCVPVRCPRPPDHVAPSTVGPSQVSAAPLSHVSVSRLQSAPACSERAASQVSWAGLTSRERATLDHFFAPRAPAPAEESAKPSPKSLGMVRSTSSPAFREELGPRRNAERTYLALRDQLDARREPARRGA